MRQITPPPAPQPSIARKAVHFLVGLSTLLVLGSIGLVVLTLGDKTSGASPERRSSDTTTAHHEVQALPQSAQESTPSTAPLARSKVLADESQTMCDELSQDGVRTLDRVQLEAALGRVAQLGGVLGETMKNLRTELQGSAASGLFLISGEITSRRADSVTVWGYAIPENADSRQLGSHMGEANLVVSNPHEEGIMGGLRYEGVHSYLRETQGTNAFNAAVPVSVYGDVSSAIWDRQAALQAEIKALEDAKLALFKVYARVRRAFIAGGAHHELTSDDVAQTESFVSALYQTPFDEDEFSRADKHWPNTRYLHDEGVILSGGEYHEQALVKRGTILGLMGSQNVALLTRIHDGQQLARFLPEERWTLLRDAVDQPLPAGSESLVGVLTDQKWTSASVIGHDFKVSVIQRTIAPELIRVSLVPVAASPAWRELIVLCMWDGSTTRVLATTLIRPTATVRADQIFLDIESATVDPLGVNWRQ